MALALPIQPASEKFLVERFDILNLLKVINNKMRYLKSVIKVFALLLLAAGALLPAHAEPVRVAVSVLPQLEIVERIGGERIQVEALLEQGDSCGVFEARPGRLAWLARADVFFRIGVDFETTMVPRIRESMPRVRVVDLREGLTLHRVVHEHHGERVVHWDPHTWMDPVLVKAQARRIAAVLSEIDADGEADYQANLDVLIAEIDSLHNDIEAALRGHRGSVFFVYHPAYGYFAERYGLEQVAVQTAGRDPTARELRNILNFARESDVKVIFIQPQESRRHAERIAAAIGAEVLELDPMASNWMDNLRKMSSLIAQALSR